jgi:hypothetical protein
MVSRASLVTLTLLALPAVAHAQGAAGTDGAITTIAGNGQVGSAGDGGPAGQAQLSAPADVAYLADGSLVIADSGNSKIRRVGPGGIITTAAGTGFSDFGGDGGQATDADLDTPGGVTALPGGGYLITDTQNHRVRRVAPDGTIATVAGSSSSPGLGGDGGPATAARLNAPTDTTVLPDGGFLIADTGNARVRRVGPDGVISTIVGTSPGFSGDGGPATAAQLSSPRDLTLDSAGRLVVADAGNHRLRRVEANGIITTVAGTGAPALAGDGEPARDARLSAPGSVVPLSNGGLLLTDSGNARVRRVTPLGAIVAVAGSAPGTGGDGGPAKGARLNAPGGLTLAPGGSSFLVADTANATVRQVGGFGAIPPAVLRRSIVVAPRIAGTTVAPLGAPGALPLLEQDIVPSGSAVDATAGKIAVTAAKDPSGVQQTAEIYDGPFTVSQVDSPRGTTTDLRVPRLDGCGGSGARSVPSDFRATKKKKAKRKKKQRRLWVSDRGGNWRTSTGSTSASSVGTRWATTLLCDGTRVTVSEGRVRVRDRRTGRSVLLSPGQSVKIPTTGARRGA